MTLNPVSVKRVQTLETRKGRRKASLEKSSFMCSLRTLSSAFRSTPAGAAELLPRRGILLFSRDLLVVVS